MPRSAETIASQVEVGRRLALLRARANVSQVEVGKRLGYSQTAIARFEAGSRRLTFLDAVAFCALYASPVSVLDPAQPFESGRG